MSRADLVLHWPHTAESICWGVIPLISKCEPCAHRGLLGLQFRRPGSPAWLIPPSPYFPFILRATCCIYKSRAHSYSQPSIIYTTLVFSFDSSTIMKLAREIFTSSVRLMRRESKEKYPFFNLPRVEFLKACILHTSPRQDFNQCEMVLWYRLGPGWSPAAVMERQWEVTLLADRMRFENVLCSGVWGVRGITCIFCHFTLFVVQPVKMFHWRGQMSGI